MGLSMRCKLVVYGGVFCEWGGCEWGGCKWIFNEWDGCRSVFMNGVFVNGFINVFINALITEPPQAWEEHFRDPQSGVFLPFGCYLMKKELRFDFILS